MKLVSELRRRNVLRMAALYVVAAWLIVQVAGVLIDLAKLPDWIGTTTLWVLIIGFPIALIFSWFYEMTPEGIGLEKDADPDVALTHVSDRRLDFLVISLLCAAVILFAFDKWGISDPPDQSVAVLPFADMSPNGDQGYFGNGIADELLNALAKFPDLKVAARTSAFSFADKDVELREVGETLGVAHILEGSVQRSGERLRITAQLIRVADGFNLWSDSYERQFADIFDIQDEIVAELSRVLQFRLGVGAGAGRAADRNVDARAYEQYLRGLNLWWQREKDSEYRTGAVTAFRLATELDPDFADAWAVYGSALSMSTFGDSMSEQERVSQAEISLRRAVELNPRNVRAHSGLVYFHMGILDLAAAREHARQALEIAPNDATAQYAVAQLYWATGDIAMMIQAFDRAISLDPLNRTIQRVYFQLVAGTGRYSKAAAAIEMSADCVEGECDINHYDAAWYLMMGALVSSSDNEVRRRKEKLDYLQQLMLESFSPGYRSYSEFFLSFAKFSVDEQVDRDYWRSVDISSRFFSDCFLAVGSILAQVGEDERALDFLSSQDSSKILRSADDCQYPLLPGRFELPERIRRDSRYHGLWSSPGMQGLAEIRRANGQTAGLPLPMNSN